MPFGFSLVMSWHVLCLREEPPWRPGLQQDVLGQPAPCLVSELRVLQACEIGLEELRGLSLVVNTFGGDSRIKTIVGFIPSPLPGHRAAPFQISPHTLSSVTQPSPTSVAPAPPLLLLPHPLSTLLLLNT